MAFPHRDRLCQHLPVPEMYAVKQSECGRDPASFRIRGFLQLLLLSAFGAAFFDALFFGAGFFSSAAGAAATALSTISLPALSFLTSAASIASPK